MEIWLCESTVSYGTSAQGGAPRSDRVGKDLIGCVGKDLIGWTLTRGDA